MFWNAATIGRNAKKEVHHKVLNQMVKKVETLNPELDLGSFVSLSVYDEDASSGLRSLDSSIQGQKFEPFANARNAVNKISPENQLSDRSDTDNPILFGSFTNWKGMKMMRLEDFVLLLAKKYGR